MVRIATIIAIIMLGLVANTYAGNVPSGAGPGEGAEFAEVTNYFYLEAVCIPEIYPEDESIFLGDFWIESNNPPIPVNLDPDDKTCGDQGSGIPMLFKLYGQEDATYKVLTESTSWVQAGSEGKIHLTWHWEVVDANTTNQMQFACGTEVLLNDVKLLEGEYPCDAYAEIRCFANYIAVEPGAAPGQYSFNMKVHYELLSY